MGRFRVFIKAYDEALFLDTRFGGLDLEDSVEAACRSARSALAVFGVATAGDDWVLRELPPALTPPEQQAVKRAFYELLLILADGVSQTPKAEPAQRAKIRAADPRPDNQCALCADTGLSRAPIHIPRRVGGSHRSHSRTG